METLFIIHDWHSKKKILLPSCKTFFGVPHPEKILRLSNPRLSETRSTREDPRRDWGLRKGPKKPSSKQAGRKKAVMCWESMQQVVRCFYSRRILFKWNLQNPHLVPFAVRGNKKKKNKHQCGDDEPTFLAHLPKTRSKFIRKLKPLKNSGSACPRKRQIGAFQ